MKLNQFEIFTYRTTQIPVIHKYFVLFQFHFKRAHKYVRFQKLQKQKNLFKYLTLCTQDTGSVLFANKHF